MANDAGIGRIGPGMTRVEHGGNLAEARRLFPGAPEPWIDLSTGISPRAYPLPPIPAQAWTALPLPDAVRALEATAAGYYGAASAAHVVAVPGTQAAIQWLPRLFTPTTVAILGPTYAEHARGWALAGHRVAEVCDTAGLHSATICVVVNPNNPDGRILQAEPLLQLAAEKHRSGGVLVVDEAFADVTPGVSLAARSGAPGLVILRSLGKFFGLAGIRLGFVLAASPLSQALRQAMGPWAVSGEAIVIGEAALADRAWQAETRTHLARMRGALEEELGRIGDVIGGTDLFCLLESPDAPYLFGQFGRSGIWVRRFASNPRWLRFGLPADDGARERLRRALQSGSN
jgi:cobalamin biosynthetic protein CobC